MATLTEMRVRGAKPAAKPYALIEQAEGGIISAECSRKMAKELARHLYGGPIRLSGNARWERTDAGEWRLISFKAKEFRALRNEDLATSVARLQKIGADWKGDDAIQFLNELREGNGETH